MRQAKSSGRQEARGVRVAAGKAAMCGRRWAQDGGWRYRGGGGSERDRGGGECRIEERVRAETCEQRVPMQGQRCALDEHNLGGRCVNEIMPMTLPLQ